MAIHGDVSDNCMTAAVGIDNTETIQKGTRILVGLKPGGELRVIEAAFMHQLFDGDTIYFPVTLIVIPCNVLSCKIKSASDTSLSQILHFL